MINIDKIKELINGTDADVEKLEKGQKAAGPRIRKALMNIIKACKSGRQEVQEIKGNGKADVEEKVEESTEPDERPEEPTPC